MRDRASLLPSFLALVFLATAGCSINIADDPWHHSLDASVRATAAEINVHYSVLTTVSSLAQGRAEVDRHAAVMQSHQRELRVRLHAMSCEPGGEDLMMGLMSSVDGRVATYLAAAAQAPTLGELRGLCREYADDMDSLFDRMGDRADTMDCVE